MAAQFILDKIGDKSRLIELEGILGASATRERGEGFNTFSKDKLEIVEQQAADFERARG